MSSTVDRERAPPRPLAARIPAPSEVAWRLLLPSAAVALGIILLTARPLADVLFPPDGFDFTPFRSAQPSFGPKHAQLTRFLLLVLAAFAFALLVVVAARRRRRQSRQVALQVLAIQCVSVGLLVFFFVKQRDAVVEATTRVYFTTPTLIVAVLLTGATFAALRRPPRWTARLRTATPAARWTCAFIALAATVVWLLPNVYSDANIALAPDGITKHVEFTFDETISVLNGRSPLVNMTTYGALVPYLLALPLNAAGTSLAAFMVLMSVLTGLALLAVYAVLRRLSGNAFAALALYVPFLATSLFWVNGTAVLRYDFGNYFAIFPIRYGGPYLLAWLITRHLYGDRPRQPIALFAVAGLVLLNNTDFGLPALVATIAALLCAQPPRSFAAGLRLLRPIVAGLVLAFAAVSALTLLRAGTLPHVGRLTTFAQLIAVGGFGNLPTPLLGLHLVIYATFLAALATAAVRLSRGATRAPLTGMLAWSGIFGLGTGSYYMYRPHPDVLIAVFSSWTFALALLVVAIVPAVAQRASRRPTPIEAALVFAFALTACSVTQLPLPWKQVQRMGQHAPTQPLLLADAQRFVRAHTRPGEHVAIPIPLGHRLAYESGVVNVVPYTGLPQMPAVEQLDETVRLLRAEGGHTFFLGEFVWAEVPIRLHRLGYREIAKDETLRMTVLSDRPG